MELCPARGMNPEKCVIEVVNQGDLMSEFLPIAIPNRPFIDMNLQTFSHTCCLLFKKRVFSCTQSWMNQERDLMFFDCLRGRIIEDLAKKTVFEIDNDFTLVVDDIEQQNIQEIISYVMQNLLDYF